MAEEDLAKLLLVAKKVRDYLVLVRGAFAFAVFGMMICGTALLVTGILSAYPTSPEIGTLVFALAYIAAFIAGFVMISKATPRGPMIPEKERVHKVVFILCFALPFPIVYIVIDVLDTLNIPVEPLYGSIWFLGLGISLLLVHIFIERRYKFKGRPFLIAGLLIVLQSPFVILLSYQCDYAGSLTATGLVLIDYIIASTILLKKGREILGI